MADCTPWGCSRTLIQSSSFWFSGLVTSPFPFPICTPISVVKWPFFFFKKSPCDWWTWECYSLQRALSLSSIQISSSCRMCQRWYIMSALSSLEVIGYFTQSKAHFPCTHPVPAPLPFLSTTANPAGNSFDADSPPTADHFSFIWEKSQRPLMCPPSVEQHQARTTLSKSSHDAHLNWYLKGLFQRQRETPFKNTTNVFQSQWARKRLLRVRFW